MVRAPADVGGGVPGLPVADGGTMPDPARAALAVVRIAEPAGFSTFPSAFFPSYLGQEAFTAPPFEKRGGEATRPARAAARCVRRARRRFRAIEHRSTSSDRPGRAQALIRRPVTVWASMRTHRSRAPPAQGALYACSVNRCRSRWSVTVRA